MISPTLQSPRAPKPLQLPTGKSQMVVEVVGGGGAKSPDSVVFLLPRHTALLQVPPTQAAGALRTFGNEEGEVNRRGMEGASKARAQAATDPGPLALLTPRSPSPPDVRRVWTPAPQPLSPPAKVPGVAAVALSLEGGRGRPSWCLCPSPETASAGGYEACLDSHALQRRKRPQIHHECPAHRPHRPLLDRGSHARSPPR